jgi:hypothetical protein
MLMSSAIRHIRSGGENAQNLTAESAKNAERHSRN